MQEAQTIPAKYLFLDVVGFTHERSVEAQTEIVQSLNEIVRAAVTAHEIPTERLIYLPTGDGLCIALLNIEFPYDVHLLIAIEIISGIHQRNLRTEDKMRTFQIRIGINVNTDNLIVDINGNANIAGAGINIASRIMNMGDGNQILVGESVYETLRYREKYLNSFKRFTGTVKHDQRLPVYQYLSEAVEGLSNETPSEFQSPSVITRKLPRAVAYYFAHAIRNRKFIVDNKGYTQGNRIVILLWFLANDSKALAQATESDLPYLQSYKAEESASLTDQLAYYTSLHFPIVQTLADLIISKFLEPFSKFFEANPYMPMCFVNTNGGRKLQSEYPEIWAELELGAENSISNSVTEPVSH